MADGLGGVGGAQALTVGGDASLNGPAEALPQVEPVWDLDGVGGAGSGTHGVSPALSPQMLSTPGWVVSHAASGPASRVGSTSTTRWVSPQVETVEYVLPRRIAKSSTPSTRGVPNCGSESVMTLRNVLRPAPKPSWAASPAPGRPASASPTRSRTWMSRVVNRAYWAVNWGNGSANVRRRQFAAPQM